MHRTQPKFFLIVATVFLIVVLAIYGVLLWYIHEGKARLQMVHASEAITRRAEEQRLLVERNLRQSKTKLDELAGYFLEEADIPRFIEKLEALSQETGVQLRLSSLSAETKPTAALLIALSAEGRFSALSHFLRALETLPLRSELTAVSFHNDSVSMPPAGDTIRVAPSGADSALPWTANIQVRVLSFHPKQ
ncbi:MAG: hypothetical protein A2542_02955 [Parcubacteria group bacterium RIFOXYD2_FULL_52_8]|nr:MAG: hypothetical protein A2542_02955 [Parcubacteria group bacterium RIFOXYD2_FULL_52_8]